MNKHTKLFAIVSLMLIAFAACDNDKNAKKATATKNKPTKSQVVPPAFNADSAYSYVAAQVAFGPRVPNTAAHQKAAAYLESFMRSKTAHVLLQPLQEQAFDGTLLNGVNIIAQFNPQESKRILLAAHWDSRPFADQEEDAGKHHTPIDGANDGASGVGVLMELARLMHQKAPEVGVDIIFFDLEDYGVPEFEDYSDNESWALGSRYWAKNPMPVDYRANFGVLLDMVGAKNAVFRVEAYSKYYAPGIVKKVWQQGRTLGYTNTFLLEDGGVVLDDHIAINDILGLPMIDIIHHDNSTSSGFFPHWHKVSDNLDQIDKQSLKIVGETLAYVIYNE